MGVQSYIISTCQLSALRHSSVILGLWSDISGGGQLLFSPCSQAHRSLRRAVESPKPARSDRVGGGRLRECSLWTCSTDCYVTAPSPADSVEAEHVSESRPRFDLKVGHVSTLPRAGLWVYLFFFTWFICFMLETLDPAQHRQEPVVWIVIKWFLLVVLENFLHSPTLLFYGLG